MDPATITAIAEAVTAIVNGIIKAAPAIEQGVASATPYVEALIGMVSGTNVTQAQLDAAVAQIVAQSQQFQEPLPPDDGTTTT